MRKFPSLLIAFFAIATSFSFTSVAHAEPAPTPPGVRSLRLLIAPFVNQSGRPSLDYLSFQLAENLAERFESEPGLTVLNGQFPLMTEAQAKTLDAPEGAIQAACDLAKKRGADRLLTGTFKGNEWNWNLHVEIRDVADCRPETTLGFGDAQGDQRVPIKLKSGKMMPIVNTQSLQSMLENATMLACFRAHVSLSTETMKALRTVSTTDSFANILMGRAVDRFLRPLDINHHRAPLEAALDFAGHAVQVDPKFVEARRFYAFLLESKLGKDGKPQMAKARIHYEAVLAGRPHDVRSLIRLGHIEFAANHIDTAKGYLAQATALRPADPEPRFWLGEALLKTDDNDGATSAFETVRTLEPDGLRARRRLAELYAAREDHLMAAEELKVIVAAEPNNLDAVFEEAACLRQGSKDQEALEVYYEAAKRFPKEQRFRKFATYITEPMEPVGPAIGDYLVSTIVAGRQAAMFADALRNSYQRAANDAVLDLSLNKEDACHQDRGAASVVAAQEARDHFLKKRGVLKTAATLVDTARKNGEWAFLTSDLRALAQNVLNSSKSTETDVRETGAQFNGPVARLVASNHCNLTDLTPTPSDTIMERNALREVTLPKVEPPRSMLAITPEVPAEAAKDTQFTVDNTQGSESYEVIVDGESVGKVEPGSIITRPTSSGYHTVCLRDLDGDCAPGSKSGRLVHLHDGLGIRIRHGGGPELASQEEEN